MSYIFGGDTGETADSIKRKRRMVEQLMLANARAPRNVGEGLTAIGRALQARVLRGRADKAEKTNREGIEKDYGYLWGEDSQSAVAGDVVSELGLKGVQPERREPTYQAVTMALMDPRMTPQRRAALSPILQSLAPMSKAERARFDWQRERAAKSDEQWQAGHELAQRRLGIAQAKLAQPDKPSAAEERIARLTSTGISRDLAIGIADGRLKPSRHPYTGEVVVVDLATGGPVQLSPQDNAALQGAAQTVQDAPAEAAVGPSAGGSIMPTEGADYETAVGPLQGLASIINAGGEVFGVGRPFPETDKAATAIKNLRTRTMTTLQGAIPGRPSNYLLQQIDQLSVKPGALQGPEGAADVARQTRDMIKNAIAENNQILANPQDFDRTQVAQARAKNIQMENLMGDYDALIAELEGAGDDESGGEEWNEGDIVFNPQTGEQMILKDREWRPYDG